MKVLLIIITALFITSASAGAYFITDLNGQINDLQDNLEQEIGNSLDKLDTRFDEASMKLNDELNAVNNEIDETKSSLVEYAASTGVRFTEIKADIDRNFSEINGVNDRIDLTEAVVNDSIMQAGDLYEQVKESIVRISDGEQLSGSGFLLSGSGSSSESVIKIVSAYHVVDDLSGIYVTLYDGRTWKAKIYARCESSDVVILTLIKPVNGQLPDSSSLTSVSLADSSNVRPGDPVFVVGSPGDEADSQLGLRETINTGIISQVNRAVKIGDESYANLLQFDAAANYGNSGGPLFNRNGEVVGVVIARINPVYGDGVSFAVASNMVKKVEDSITGVYANPYIYRYPEIGLLTIVDVAPKDIEESGNTITGGVRVVLSGYPASNAGVMKDDIITMIDGKEVRDCGDLSSYIAEYCEPGDSVVLNIVRNGQQISVTVVLGEGT